MDSNFNIYLNKINNNKMKIIILVLAIAATTLTACNSKMDMVNDPAGYGMGFPYHWIYGIIILTLVVFIVYKLIKRNKSLKQ